MNLRNLTILLTIALILSGGGLWWVCRTPELSAQERYAAAEAVEYDPLHDNLSVAHGGDRDVPCEGCIQVAEGVQYVEGGISFYWDEPNDDDIFVWDTNTHTIQIDEGNPTYECPVHGILNNGGWSADFTTIHIDHEEIYRGCANCTLLYVAEVLKDNVPQITKIEKETSCKE